MAKRSTPNSGGSQFFLVYANSQLSPEYTVFGTIAPEGLPVLDAIASKGHNGAFEAQAGGGRPNVPVPIKAVKVSWPGRGGGRFRAPRQQRLPAAGGFRI